MKRLLLCLTVLATLLMITGCGAGVVDSGRDRQERWKRVMEMDARQINDDIDSLLLMDRPSRLTWARVE